MPFVGEASGSSAVCESCLANVCASLVLLGLFMAGRDGLDSTFLGLPFSVFE